MESISEEKQIEIPASHYRTAAKREYSSWMVALVREFYQNGVDAESTEIHFDIKEIEDYSVLTVKNNGRDMTLEECEQKLLTLGGTDKTVNDVGGYGVAKQILYFAWDKWEILFGYYRVQGRGCRYRIFRTTEYVKGVTSVVYIDKKDRRPTFDVYNIEYYLGKCKTNVKTYINGEFFERKREEGNFLFSLDYGILFKNEVEGSSHTNQYLCVRVNGIFMFETYVTNNIKCQLTLELTGSTRESLTSNRDGLKGEIRNEYNKLIRDIAVNPLTSLLEKPTYLIKKFPGTGSTSISTRSEEIYPAVNKEDILNKEEIKSYIKSIVFIAKEHLTVDNLKKEQQNILSIQYLKKACNDEVFDFDRPDILIKSKNEIPKDFNPKTWGLRAKAVMSLWHSAIKQIFIDSGTCCVFGIGIVLDDNIEAEFLMHEDIPYFLLNLGNLFTQKNVSFNRIKIRGHNLWMLIRELKQKAIHEITHFASNGDHNEEFVSIYELLDSKTWKSEEVYKSFMKFDLRKFFHETESSNKNYPQTSYAEDRNKNILCEINA